MAVTSHFDLLKMRPKSAHSSSKFAISASTVGDGPPKDMSVVGILPIEGQTKESARRDKRPSPGYCVAICFYYAALGHMFLLVGCGRGVRPYVSIGWLWAWRWAICFYWLAVGVALGHMFVFVGCAPY